MSLQLNWTKLLKRKLLGQTLKTTEHDGKFYAVYDAIEVAYNGDGRVQVALMLDGKRLFEWDAVRLDAGSVLNLSGLRGEQEITLT